MDGHTDEPQGEEELRRELNRLKDEKETLATQYQNLVAKLNQMRTTLGTKLKQDAVCLFTYHALLGNCEELIASSYTICTYT
jgi:hypothetical protein